VKKGGISTDLFKQVLFANDTILLIYGF